MDRFPLEGSPLRPSHRKKSQTKLSCKVLITGSEGLIGSKLSSTLQGNGCEILPFDILLPLKGGYGNVSQLHDVSDAVKTCDGIIHLAAVSRVIWGERDPDLCWHTNADGTANVLQAALQSNRKPWVLVASSREVYGQPGQLPANEDCPLNPINIYGRAKVQGEQHAFAARETGLRTAVVRLSNVYGTTTDHVDRVVRSKSPTQESDARENSVSLKCFPTSAKTRLFRLIELFDNQKRRHFRFGYIVL